MIGFGSSLPVSSRHTFAIDFDRALIWRDKRAERWDPSRLFLLIYRDSEDSSWTVSFFLSWRTLNKKAHTVCRGGVRICNSSCVLCAMCRHIKKESRSIHGVFKKIAPNHLKRERKYRAVRWPSRPRWKLKARFCTRGNQEYFFLIELCSSKISHGIDRRISSFFFLPWGVGKKISRWRSLILRGAKKETLTLKREGVNSVNQEIGTARFVSFLSLCSGLRIGLPQRGESVLKIHTMQIGNCKKIFLHSLGGYHFVESEKEGNLKWNLFFSCVWPSQ